MINFFRVFLVLCLLLKWILVDESGLSKELSTFSRNTFSIMSPSQQRKDKSKKGNNKKISSNNQSDCLLFLTLLSLICRIKDGICKRANCNPDFHKNIRMNEGWICHNVEFYIQEMLEMDEMYRCSFSHGAIAFLNSYPSTVQDLPIGFIIRMFIMHYVFYFIRLFTRKTHTSFLIF